METPNFVLYLPEIASQLNGIKLPKDSEAYGGAT